VRIGTAEIYRVVDAMDGILDSLVVGVPYDDDVRVILFVVTANGALSAELDAELRAAIRRECTPRHVPFRIHPAPDVPRTISGKRVEIAVTRILGGGSVANRDALKNPEALDYFSELRPNLFA